MVRGMPDDAPMEGFPPPRESVVNLGNWQEPPFIRWSFQHLREVAIDHQNGIFAGKNDLVEKLGGRPPMTLEVFIEKHRAAFV